jgi:hypothetical protein
MMGSVAMESHSLDPIPGVYSAEQTTVYVYCDECGSFNIATHISLKTWLWIAVAVLVNAVLWNDLKDHALPGAGFACWSVFAMLLLGLLWESRADLGHKCRECGNTEISTGNVLNYPPGDRSVLDIPEHWAHKHYLVF